MFLCVGLFGEAAHNVSACTPCHTLPNAVIKTRKHPVKTNDNLPSGKLTKNSGKSPFLMGKSLFLSPFSIAFCIVYQGSSRSVPSSSIKFHEVPSTFGGPVDLRRNREHIQRYIQRYIYIYIYIYIIICIYIYRYVIFHHVSILSH